MAKLKLSKDTFRELRTWILSAFLLAVIYFAVTNSETFHACIEHQQFKESQKLFARHLGDVPITWSMYQRCMSEFVEKSAEGIIAAFTVILAVSTIFLWLSTKRLSAGGEEQLRLSREAYVTDQRAWIAVKLFPDGDARISEEHISMSVSLKISNLGKTPALDVHTDITMMYFDRGDLDVRTQLKQFCDKKREFNIFGRPLPPGDFYFRKWGPSLERDKSKEYSTVALPVIMGCVTYQILPDKSLHQTSFAYIVGVGNDLLPLENPIVPQVDLEFTVTSGGFAD